MNEHKTINITKTLKQSILTFILSLIPVLGVYYISLSLSHIDLLHSGFISKGIEYFSNFLPILILSAITIIIIATVAVFFSTTLSKTIKIKYVLSLVFFIIGVFLTLTYLDLIQEIPFHIALSLIVTLFITGIVISAQSIFKYIIKIIMNVFMIISFYALFSSLLAVYSNEFNDQVELFNSNAKIGFILLTLFAVFFVLPFVVAIIYKHMTDDSQNEINSELDSTDNKISDKEIHEYPI